MTVYGWDASHYDWDRGGMDIAGAEREGIAFMTHKLGEGSNYTDSRFDDYWARVTKTDIIPGAYYVLHRGNAVAQADRFIAMLDAKAKGWRDRDFILQADCESWNGGAIPEPTPGDIEAFCDRLAAKAPQCRPVVYAPKWVYQNRLINLSYSLWASNYGTNTVGAFKSLYPGDTSSRWGAYSGRTPAILQYGSKLRIAGQGSCDANGFRGDRAEFIKLVSNRTSEEIDVEQKEKLLANTGSPGRTIGDFLGDVQNFRNQWVTKLGGTVVNPAQTGSPFDLVMRVANGFGMVASNVGNILTNVVAMRGELAALAGKDFVDEEALITGLLARFPNEELADLIVSKMPADEASALLDALGERLRPPTS